MTRAANIFFVFIVLLTLGRPAVAGPPYVSDDPEPTDYKHFEIYTFSSGRTTRDGTSGEAGIDFNYGAAPDLQLTAVVPGGFDSPRSGTTMTGFSNVELAAKYRFLHQETFGLDVSVFPRVFLPSGSSAVGQQHASLLLPIWVEKDWGGVWSAFGGGGCAINNGDGSQDFCMIGGVLARQVRPDLQLGLELFHQTPDTVGGRATTGLGAGLHYDLTENYHVLAYGGPGLQNAAATDQYSWYAALLTTF